MLNEPIDKFHPLYNTVQELDALAPIPEHLRNLPSRCSPDCKGWAVFEARGFLEIERCDECDAFEEDDDAAPYAVAAGLLVSDAWPYIVVVGVQPGALDRARAGNRKKVWAEIARLAGDTELGRYYAEQARGG